MKQSNDALSPSRPLGGALLLLTFSAVSFLFHGSVLAIATYGDDFIFIKDKIGTLKEGLLAYLQVAPDRPLLMASVWLNFRLSGMNIPVFRATGLVLHALTALALFHLLWLLGRKHLDLKSWRIPLVLSVLFLVHPVHTEVLRIVCQRCVILTALFSILSIFYFIKYVDGEGRRNYSISLIAFVLAMAAKANAMAVPVILALYIGCFHRERLRKLLPELIPHLLVVALPFLYYSLLKANPQYALPWHQYFLAQLRVLFIYFRLFFLPLHLRQIYDIDTSIGWLSPWTLGAIAGHFLIIGFAFWTGVRRGRWLLAFSILAVYLALAPESSVFPIRYLIWEYRTYFPLTFLMIALMALFPALERHKGLLALLLLLVLPASYIANRERNAEIQTTEKLIENTLHYTTHLHEFNSETLAYLLDAENLQIGLKTIATIREANPDTLEYKLYDVAFQYLNEPAGRRGQSRLDQIANVLMTTRSDQISNLFRGAMNRFLFKNYGQHLKGAAADEKLEELCFSELYYVDPDVIADPAVLDFVKNYSITLAYLKPYYEDLLARGKASPVEQARLLRVLAALEVYFERITPGLADRFEKFISAHPEASQTKQVYEWYLHERQVHPMPKATAK